MGEAFNQTDKLPNCDILDRPGIVRRLQDKLFQTAMGERDDQPDVPEPLSLLPRAVTDSPHVRYSCPPNLGP